MGAVMSALAPFVPIIVDHILKALLYQKPNVPAPMPTQEETGKSPDQLRQEARAEFGIDSVNCFNFGFAGMSGTGKSSLINAMRSVDDTSPDAARVDEVECTTSIKMYVHPENSHMVLWDIPGGGTQKHNASTYFMDKKLYAFDTIIIIGADRFTELDIEIAKAARAFNVPMAFVRSKSDFSIDNRAHRLKKPKKEVKGDVKKAIVADLRSQLPEGLRDRQIFVISSRVFGGAYDGFRPDDYALDEVALLEYVLTMARDRRIK